MSNQQKKGKATQLSFRLWDPYSERVVKQAKAAGIKPTQLARIATMVMVDSGLFSQKERLQRIEDELIRLRKDFNDAVG